MLLADSTESSAVSRESRFTGLIASGVTVAVIRLTPEGGLFSGGVTKTPAVTPRITTKPGVCGGDAIVAGTRIPVWWLELARRKGMSQSRILKDFPQLSKGSLKAAWDYVKSHEDDIEKQISENSGA